LVVSLFLFCFFFQAEDGIRDFHVTGVQTCALPIWAVRRPRDRDLDREPAKLEVQRPGSDPVRQPGCTGSYVGSFQCSMLMPSGRSEERRVGKECRSRWGRYNEREEQ